MAQEMLTRPDLYPRPESPELLVPEDVKESIGSSPSPFIASPQSTVPPTANTLPSNWNVDNKLVTIIGKQSSISSEKCPEINYSSCLEDRVYLPSSPTPLPVTSIPSKMKATLVPSGSSSVKELSAEINRKIGNVCYNKLKTELLKKSQPTSIFVITGPSMRFIQDVYDQLFALEELSYCGVKLKLEKLTSASGTTPMLIIKIPKVSGSMAMWIKKYLLSMNFEAVSQYHSYSDFSIAVCHYWFRPKDLMSLFVQEEFLLLRTYLQNNGIKQLTWKHNELSFDV